LSLAKGKVFEMIKSDFESLGYKVEARILNAAEYGVPQARERVIIIGNRIGVENPFPIKTHYLEGTPEENRKGLLPAITTEQAIGFLQNKKLEELNPTKKTTRILVVIIHLINTQIILNCHLLH